ncbi:MAG: DMT family transporter [Bacteroidetes bacterium]|nr:DMT family transporter [Bacteroidota bacterium]
MLRDYLKLHFVVFLWGTTAVMAKLITIPATEMLFHRTWMAAAGLFVLALISGTVLKYTWKDLLSMLGIGLIVGLHWVAFFVGGQISTASLSLVGFATCSLWAALLEPLVNRQPVRALEVFLGLVVMAGLYIIFRSEFHFMTGFLLSILSGLLAAVFGIMNSKLVKRISSVAIAFYEMVGAFVFVVLMLPLYQAYYAEGGELQMIPAPTDWIYLLILSLLCSVFAFTMSVDLMKRLSVFTVQLTLNLEPVYGIILAVILLGEGSVMGTSFYVGTSLILVAVLLYPWLKKRLT